MNSLHASLVERWHSVETWFAARWQWVVGVFAVVWPFVVNWTDDFVLAGLGAGVGLAVAGAIWLVENPFVRVALVGVAMASVAAAGGIATERRTRRLRDAYLKRLQQEYERRARIAQEARTILATLPPHQASVLRDAGVLTELPRLPEPPPETSWAAASSFLRSVGRPAFTFVISLIGALLSAFAASVELGSSLPW